MSITISNPRRRRARPRIAMLSAAAVFAAGVQAHAPASVAANVNQDDSGPNCSLVQVQPNSCLPGASGGGEVIVINGSNLGVFEGHGGRSIGTAPAAAIGGEGGLREGNRGGAGRRRSARNPERERAVKQWMLNEREAECRKLVKDIQLQKDLLRNFDLAPKRGESANLGRFVKSAFDPILAPLSPWKWVPFSGGRPEAVAYLRDLEGQLSRESYVGDGEKLTCADFLPADAIRRDRVGSL